MADRLPTDRWTARLLRGPSKTEWLLLITIDALGLLGLAIGVLGPIWYILTPWTAGVAYMAFTGFAAYLDGRRPATRGR